MLREQAENLKSYEMKVEAKRMKVVVMLKN